MMGEFGTSWQAWNLSADPYLRGFREGIWAGALGGSTGTSMAWWWQNIASDNGYPVYSALTTILGRTGWGVGPGLISLSAVARANSARWANAVPAKRCSTWSPRARCFPAGATNAALPTQQNQTLTMSSWPQGTYYAEWYDPATGSLVGTSQATTAAGRLTLPLPNYTVDLAGIVYPPPTLSSPQVNAAGRFQLRLNSETGGRYSCSGPRTWFPGSAWVHRHQHHRHDVADRFRPGHGRRRSVPRCNTLPDR